MTDFRAPLYVRTQRKREVFAEPARNLLLSTLAVAVIAPFIPFQQPQTPRTKRNYEALNPPNLPLSTLDFQTIAAANIETLPLYPKRNVTDTNVRNLLLTLPNVLPPGKARHESAPARRAPVVDTSVVNVLLGLPAVTTTPFTPNDTNPQSLRKRNAPPIEVQNWIAERTALPILPFYSNGFESAPRGRGFVQDTQPINLLVRFPTGTVPFFQEIFDAPLSKRQVADSNPQSSPRALLSTVVLQPFAQLEWQEPKNFEKRYQEAYQWSPLPSSIPPPPVSYTLAFYHPLTLTGSLTGGSALANDTAHSLSSGFPGTDSYSVIGSGTLITRSFSGTAQLRLRAEVAGVVTAKAGMVLIVEKVA